MAHNGGYHNGDVFAEGPWTPAITFGTAGDLSVGYTTQFGWWERRLNKATLWCNVLTKSFTYTTASGTLLVTGLPFTSRSTTSFNSSGALSQIRGYTKANFTQVMAQLTAGSATIRFNSSGSGQTPAPLTATDVPSAGTVNLVFQIDVPI